MLRRRSGRPRNPNPRREIQVAADVVLVLISQSVTYCQVRPISPIVLSEPAEIELTDIRFWISGRDLKLRGAPAQQADLRGGQSGRQALLGDLKRPDAGQTLRIRKRSGARECPTAAEVVRREIVYAHCPHARAELNRVLAHRQRRDFGNFKSILSVRRFTDLRTATRESFLHVNRGN